MLLNDLQIAAYARQGMITPFEPGQVRHLDHGPAVSFGLSSFGYDMRAGADWRVPVQDYERFADGGILDVKNPDACRFTHLEVQQDQRGRFVLLPQHSFALTSSVELWDIPDDILVLTFGKSTYARVGLIVNVTPMEPGWRGILTLEVSNTTDMPVRAYVGEGIAQAIFLQGDRPAVNYASRKGKYQDQTTTTLARI